MFKFIKERNKNNCFDVSEVEFKVDSTSLEDVVYEFKLFLLSCGYSKDLELTYTVELEESDKSDKQDDNTDAVEEKVEKEDTDEA